ncbi:MAG: hypothetical protein QMD21_07865, partial [Candidatus Thermoplasmatota archaeon]|nr:hypothetical protein [Candidatus Thermoplasmatota archaeon]
MTKIGVTNNYYYNTTYSVKGVYYYYIWANDTSNNQNKSAAYQFEIDITLPIISEVQATPSVQTQRGYVNITCIVTDNVAVDTVKVNIIGPTDFTPVNITMNQIPNTNNYYYNTTYQIGGLYSYYIWANDTSANKNIPIEYYFTIMIAKTETIDGKEVNVICIGNGTVNIIRVEQPQTPPKNLQFIICINVTVTGTITYVNITIGYNESDVAG